ncbi:Uncharacterised protein [Mycobacteroides abscessus subsp. abscessus]|nr:Uncharacterised protein [Mycobacteroides abscessus subsp. abscessus]
MVTYSFTARTITRTVERNIDGVPVRQSVSVRFRALPVLWAAILSDRTR